MSRNLFQNIDSFKACEVEHMTVTISGDAQGYGRIVNLARRLVPGLMPIKKGTKYSTINSHLASLILPCLVQVHTWLEVLDQAWIGKHHQLLTFIATTYSLSLVTSPSVQFTSHYRDNYIFLTEPPFPNLWLTFSTSSALSRI